MTKKIAAAAKRVPVMPDTYEKRVAEEDLNFQFKKNINRKEPVLAMATLKQMFNERNDSRPNVFFINEFITLLESQNLYDDLISLFHMVQQSGIVRLDAVHMNRVLVSICKHIAALTQTKSHESMESAKQYLLRAKEIFLEMVKEEFFPTKVSLAHYLIALIETGNADKAYQLVHEYKDYLYEMDDGVFYPLIYHFAQHKSMTYLMKIYFMLKELNIIPSERAVKVIASSAIRSRDRDSFQVVLQEVKHRQADFHAQFVNDVIVSSYCMNRDPTQAANIILDQKLLISTEVYEMLMESLAKGKFIDHMERVNEYMLSQRVPFNKTVSLIFIKAYINASDPARGLDLFYSHRNMLFEDEDPVKVYETIIGALVQNNYATHAMKLFKMMSVESLSMSAELMAHFITSNLILKTKNFTTAQDIIKYMASTQLKLHQIPYTGIVKYLLTNNESHHVFTLFNELKKELSEQAPTIADLELFIEHVTIVNVQVSQAWLLEQLKALEHLYFADAHSESLYLKVIKKLIAHGVTQECSYFVEQMHANGMNPIEALNTLLKAHILRNNQEQAMLVYQQIAEPNANTFTILIPYFTQNQPELALKAFDRMLKSSPAIDPTDRVMNALLSMYMRLRKEYPTELEKLLDFFKSKGYDRKISPYTWYGLCNFYCNEQSFSRAVDIVRILIALNKRPSAVSIHSIIDYYGNHYKSTDGKGTVEGAIIAKNIVVALNKKFFYYRGKAKACTLLIEILKRANIEQECVKELQQEVDEMHEQLSKGVITFSPLNNKRTDKRIKQEQLAQANAEETAGELAEQDTSAQQADSQQAEEQSEAGSNKASEEEYLSVEDAQELQQQYMSSSKKKSTVAKKKKRSLKK